MDAQELVGRIPPAWEQYQIVVPVLAWQHHTFARLSIQAYNTPHDIDRLVEAISHLMPHA